MSCQTLPWWSVKGAFSDERRKEVKPSRERVGLDGSGVGRETEGMYGEGTGEGVGGTRWESLDEAWEVVSVLEGGREMEKLAGEADVDDASESVRVAEKTGD